MTHNYKPLKTSDIGLPTKLNNEAGSHRGEDHARFEFYRHICGVNKSNMARIFDVHPVTMADWWKQDDAEHRAGKMQS